MWDKFNIPTQVKCNARKAYCREDDKNSPHNFKIYQCYKKGLFLSFIFYCNILPSYLMYNIYPFRFSWLHITLASLVPKGLFLSFIFYCNSLPSYLMYNNYPFRCSWLHITLASLAPNASSQIVPHALL